MAEEVVVKEPLTPERIEEGRKLVALLDDNHFEVVAAFWLYSPEANWRLVLASPVVDKEGPRKVYGRIRTMIAAIRADFPWLDTNQITVVGEGDSLVRLLRTAIKTGKGISGIRFSRNRINDIFIEDAYIYRTL